MRNAHSKRLRRMMRRSAGPRIVISQPDGRWIGCNAMAAAMNGFTCIVWVSIAARLKPMMITFAYAAPRPSVWAWPVAAAV